MMTIKTASKKPLAFQKYLVHGAAALMLLGVTVRVLADPPASFAPPVQIGAAPGIGDTAPDSTFQWTEVPQDQRVPLTRAVFDQDGYQLFDTAGETVLVPFTNNNLYVMKFAPSDDGTLYLINQGDTPVLYVPQGGFLENATIAGARWYPFPDNFHPAQPVFLGIAPSWNAFASFGWSPGLVVRGGYFSDRSFIRGGVFLPTVGLTFEFGGSRYHDWDSYHAYYAGHPDHFYGGYGDHELRPRVFQGPETMLTGPMIAVITIAITTTTGDAAVMCSVAHAATTETDKSLFASAPDLNLQVRAFVFPQLTQRRE